MRGRARNSVPSGVIEIEIRTMRPDERAATAGVAARGMRDNPIHLAVYGDPPDARVRALERLFGALFAVVPAPPRVALRAGRVVGVAGAAPPGTCRLPPRALARVLPAVLRGGPRPAWRALRWLESWGALDPDAPHWHVGPVAVDAGLQGLGIGSRLLADFVARLDATGADAWLETDKPENVRFYERFGFEVAAETPTLGVPCWFMRRGRESRSRDRAA
jgi:ribosomal protein S18 acetylase RimI-like enzyme